MSISLCSSSTTPSSVAVSIISVSSSSVMDGSTSFFSTNFVAKSEITPKKAVKGRNSFIRKRSELWKNSETVSLRSFAKLLGIISLKRKMITVLMTEQIIENAKESRNSSRFPKPSLKKSVAMMVNTAAPAILVTLLPSRSVVRALSNLLSMYITPWAFLLPSSASVFIFILLTAEKELSVAAK